MEECVFTHRLMLRPTPAITACRDWHGRASRLEPQKSFVADSTAADGVGGGGVEDEADGGHSKDFIVEAVGQTVHTGHFGHSAGGCGEGGASGDAARFTLECAALRTCVVVSLIAANNSINCFALVSINVRFSASLSVST